MSIFGKIDLGWGYWQMSILYHGRCKDILAYTYNAPWILHTQFNENTVERYNTAIKYGVS